MQKLREHRARFHSTSNKTIEPSRKMDGHTTKPRELKIADEKKKTKAFEVLIESQDNEAGVPIPEDLCLDESSVGHCSDPRTAAGRETVTHVIPTAISHVKSTG